MCTSSPRGRTFGPGALLILVLASSCGSTPDGRSSATAAPGRAGTTERGGAQGIPSLPTEGTILYTEPVEQSGLSRRKLEPVTQVFTTTRDPQLAQDEPVHTFSGTVEGVDRGSSVSDRQMQEAIKRMLKRSGAGSRRTLTVEKFQRLWSQLKAAGLFKLPVYRGEGRPREDPYFQVTVGERTWYIARPRPSRPITALPPPGTPPESVDPAIPLLTLWRNSKLVFFQFADVE